MRRLDEQGPLSLVQTRERFPDFVVTLVKSLKATMPTIGKVRIAQMLAGAGLHLAPSTAERLIKKPNTRIPPPTGRSREGQNDGPSRVVTAKRPHQLWHADLTLVPSFVGCWVPWVPQALLPRGLFCYWIGVVLDHFSRAIVAHAVFPKQPSEDEICALLERAMERAGRAPRYIVIDRGVQFRERYRCSCAWRGIAPRFGAGGKKGSPAVIERFFRTLKSEGFSPMVVPLRLSALPIEIGAFAAWYNVHRCHQGLSGLTPAERLGPAKERPHFEPRARYPLARGDPACRRVRAFELRIQHVQGRAHLPIVELRPAA